MLIYIAILTALFIVAQALFFFYISNKFPNILKFLGYYLLTVVTGIFLFFPTCILLGNKICWDVDVSTQKTGLIVSSVIILLLCIWVWYKIIKDPKMENSSGKSVATLIVVLTVIVGLIIVSAITSPYWAFLVGH